MVYSPTTIASVRNAPDRSAVRRFGRMTRRMIRVQPAPRLWAASVSDRTSIEARPVSTARYMYGNDSTTYAATSRASVPNSVAREQRTACDCRRRMSPKTRMTARDDERHERHELHDGPQPRAP